MHRAIRSKSLNQSNLESVCGAATADLSFERQWKIMFVGVRLQATPKDKKAALVIHAKSDTVMQAVMAGLSMPIPCYRRHDSVLISHSQEEPSSKGCAFTLRVHSVHGPNCQMPLVQSVDVSFPVWLFLPPALASHNLSPILSQGHVTLSQCKQRCRLSETSTCGRQIPTCSCKG